eukprot:SAG11_NODE_1841_length_4182_cov_4.130541_5_plen_81_part_00
MHIRGDCASFTRNALRRGHLLAAAWTRRGQRVAGALNVRAISLPFCARRHGHVNEAQILDRKRPVDTCEIVAQHQHAHRV